MRSHLVHIATEQVPNRFELIHVTAEAVRLFHRPDKRTISQSINEALERIAAQGEKEREMNDYKYGAQLIAEELAEEKFGVSYFDLTEEQQLQLYGEGLESYVERRIA